MSGPGPLVQARGLRRTFRTFQRRPGLLGALRDLFAVGGEERVALHGLDLDIQPGERVGLIGPNGAGKSTTVKLLCGILSPTEGTLTVDGRQPHQQRRAHVRHIGVVFGQRTQLWWDLAVIEAFDLLAAVFQIPPEAYRQRLAQFDEVLGIGELLGQPVRELSLGQRMRCDIAAALLHRPPLLLLDEPTIGLDVAVKLRIRAFIREMNEQYGTTVILTTHDLGDVEAVCDRVLLIHRGRLLFDGSVPDLKGHLGGQRRLLIDLPRPCTPEAQAAISGGLPAQASWSDGRRLSLSFRPDEVTAAALIRALLERTEVEDLSVEEPSIDEVVARFYDEG